MVIGGGIAGLCAAIGLVRAGLRVRVLEQARLVTTEKVGRVRTCRLGPDRLAEEMAWIDRYRRLWDARFDELEAVVGELKQKEKVSGRSNQA